MIRRPDGARRQEPTGARQAAALGWRAGREQPARSPEVTPQQTGEAILAEPEIGRVTHELHCLAKDVPDKFHIASLCNVLVSAGRN